MAFLLLSAFTYLLTTTLVVLVLMQRKEPTATIAWILTIVFLPFVGAALYLWFGYARIERKVRQRQRSNAKIAEHLQKIERALVAYKILPETPGSVAPVQAHLLKVTEGLGIAAVTRGNDIRLLTDPEEAFAALEHAIAEARETIYLEYYIFRRDKTGKRIRDLLIEAAKRGVTVRLLVDGVGSWTLGDVFTLPLRKAGARFARYLPVTFLGRPWHWNLRNHRKLAIVDSTLGFIGSLNIGDEYRERNGSKQDFYDLQVSCEGPVVRQFEEVFAGDWFFATGENLLAGQSFPVPVRRGQAAAQIIASGPDDVRPTLHNMLCTAIHAAERSVRIITPYFIPDPALIIALQTAALRGVTIALMLPGSVPNLHERIVLSAGRSFFEDLLPLGIRIYEYLPGFLHAKSITVDSAWASVGTSNMDMRSFRLNFEVNLNVFAPEVVLLLDRHFTENLAHCRELSLAEFRKRPLHQKFLENSFRVLSPVL